jgi:hypothetical protein
MLICIDPRRVFLLLFTMRHQLDVLCFASPSWAQKAEVRFMFIQFFDFR